MVESLNASSSERTAAFKERISSIVSLMIGLGVNDLHVEELVHLLRQTINLDAWVPDLPIGALNHSCRLIQLKAEYIYHLGEVFGDRIIRQY